MHRLLADRLLLAREREVLAAPNAGLVGAQLDGDEVALAALPDANLPASLPACTSLTGGSDGEPRLQHGYNRTDRREDDWYEESRLVLRLRD